MCISLQLIEASRGLDVAISLGYCPPKHVVTESDDICGLTVGASEAVRTRNIPRGIYTLTFTNMKFLKIA